MAILPRYVLIEVIKVFAVSVTALTLMVVLGFVGREATAQGLPLMPTLRLIPYFLPETLRVTVPMTLLLACTTVFSRISGANEVVAVKAMGISPMVLLWPVFIFAFMMSLVTVWLNDLADSWGRTNIQRVVVEAVEEIAYSMLQSQRRYSTSTFSINVKDIDGRKLQARHPEHHGARHFAQDDHHRRGGRLAFRSGRRRAQGFPAQRRDRRGRRSAWPFPTCRSGKSP